MDISYWKPYLEKKAIPAAGERHAGAREKGKVIKARNPKNPEIGQVGYLPFEKTRPPSRKFLL